MNRTSRLISLGTVVAFGLIAFLSQHLHAGDTPVTSEAKIKNVLFIVSDDLKASVLGCYGDKVCKTPNIDKLADEGMIFNRAYCQGVSCAPSRRSFMFGRYQEATGVNLGEHFKNNGWYTARVGKIYHMRVPGDIIAGTDGQDVISSWTERFNSPGREAHTPGKYACLNLNIFTDELEGRESTGMPNRMFVSVAYNGDGSDQPDYKTATKTIELLRKHKDGPFFIAAGLVRPHYPNVAPEQYFEPYRWQDMELPEQVSNDIDDIPRAGRPGIMNSNNRIGKYPDNQKRMWAAYYATVTFMDEQVGRIINELERLGLRDTTAIVFTSDHGYHLGEHTFWQKANLHEEVVRVPLIVSVPGMKPGKTDAITELVDIYPTLAELAGLSVPEEVQGESFVPVLNNPAATVKTGALSFFRGIALREEDYAYMRYNDGTEELYDMAADPLQFTNQAANPEYSQALKRMQKRLDARIKKDGIKSRSIVTNAVSQESNRNHGLVGLRPLPRNAQDLTSDHGGSWSGLPTFEEQKSNYPFVAEHLDVVKGWLDGDFKTKRVFFEYYWGLSEDRDDLDPEKNFLVKQIRQWESQGGVVEHILICREYRLAIHRGHPDAKPGPFEEDTRILSAKDVDDIRTLFGNAHEKGLLEHDDYKLIQMVEEPSFFAENREAQAVIAKMEGIAYEAHQFNRHWPLETGWSKPEKVVRGAKWTLAQDKEYIFYYGPVIWKSKQYYEFIERDWLYKYWKAGLPKHHPRMHYYLNTFPHAHGRGRPVGPESDPHSILGLTKWLIQKIKMRPQEKREVDKELKATR